jgi:suppressor for copper-sensitivity B
MFRPIFILLAALTLISGSATAQTATDWQRTKEVDYRLISAVTATGELDTVRLGIEFDLKPGWHIYWRSPGDAGFPPELDTSASSNLAAAEFRWPRPERFLLLDIETIGYGDRVILPLDVTLAEKGKPLDFRARLNFLICDEICIPVDSDIALDIPGGAATPSEFAHDIDRFDGLVPASGSWPGLELNGITLVQSTDGKSPARLEVAFNDTVALKNPDLLVEATPDYWFGRPDIHQDGTRTIFSLPATGPGGDIDGLLGQPLTLTLLQDGAAAEIKASAPDRFGTGSATIGGESSDGGFLTILLFAWLGGLILNLMPCVLPVLSMKLVAAAGYGGAARNAIRRGFLASAAGIVFSIMLLALGAIALKAAGAAVGWGIQFQQPVFLGFMAAVIVLFALNMFGRFDIRLPGAVGDAAAAAPSHGIAGHFMTGIFATLLATPCSAPFLGLAVGFALAGSPADIALVFLMIGLGLATPYLLVAAIPGLAAALPRPGHWMIRLKQLLGLALLGTAAWLLWILTAQIGHAGTGMVAALLLLMALTVWLRPGRTLAASAAGIAAVMVAAGIAGAGPSAGRGSAETDAAIRWEVFDEAALRQHVEAGRTVLVDVTADWCVTCQVNKKLVIDRGDVAGLLSGGEVIAMRADWTSPDPVIAAYLASFGRYGIPFNALYGPGSPDGLPLPELLTTEAVLDGIRTASGGSITVASGN